MLVRSIMLLVAAGAALGCGADDVATLVADGGPVGPDARVLCASGCNPLGARGMQGCAAGQKCTAVRGMMGGLPCVNVNCVPEGFQLIGEACTWQAPAAPPYQYDDCVAGAVCADDGLCRDICGFGGGVQEACAEPLQCRDEAGLFTNGDPSLYGVCAASP